MQVDDQQVWHHNTDRIKGLLAVLPAGTGLGLTQLLSRYRKAKEALAAVVAEVDAASVCSRCGGQCCLNGKYRINVLDALAHTTADIALSADFSQKPVCPYGTDAGCIMEPGLRPADCVMFICDAIDRKLSPQARLILAAGEEDLRDCIRKASALTGEPLGTPLLLWGGKSDTYKPKV
ncbi:MAG: hypothetical protein PHH91_08125 [Desulfuromonadaceae bacterium]|nr:hypothetical protein [Desulfuromonadaceae bacterium]